MRGLATQRTTLTMHILILKNFAMRKAELYKEAGEPRIFDTPDHAADAGTNIMAASPGMWESFSTMSVVNFMAMMAQKFEIDVK